MFSGSVDSKKVSSTEWFPGETLADCERVARWSCHISTFEKPRAKVRSAQQQSSGKMAGTGFARNGARAKPLVQARGEAYDSVHVQLFAEVCFFGRFGEAGSLALVVSSTYVCC